MSSDFALEWFIDGAADLVIEDDDLKADEGLRTSILLSLFTDRRAEADDELPADDGDRRGYWADEFAEVEEDRMGSRLWLLDRTTNRADVLVDAQRFDLEALQWLIDDGVASAVEAVVTFETNSPVRLRHDIVIERPDVDDVAFRFSHVWEAEIERTPEVTSAPSPPFEWSGTFNNFPATAADVANWLGLAIEPDHLWNATVLEPADEGANPHLFSDLVDSNGAIVTDPNFGGGSRNLIQYSNHLVLGATTGGTFVHPHPSDGTRSFIIGMILQIDAQSGSDPNINIVQAVSLSPTRGMYMSVVRDDSDEDQRINTVTFWGTTPFFQSGATLSGEAAIGKPLLILWNYDFAAGLKKVITPGGMVSGPLLDLGDFTPSVILKLGDPGIGNWDGAEYTWAQMFMFDYDGSVDLELGPGNMERFLKFADGVLS